jgi:DNA polymerase elongation subunit (family B)
MLKVKQEYANTKDPKLLSEISRLNNLQMAMKILLNSAYGAMGNAYFRYFDMRIAEGITISGQLSIRWIANKLNAYFDKMLGTDGVDRIVLIDTDSVVLTLEDLVQKVYGANGEVQLSAEKVIDFMDRVAEDKIQPFIDKSYQELADYMNAYEQKMQMKRENLVDTMISVSKKRYVMSVHNSEGVQYKEPQLKIMGLQMVKSSTPSVIRERLKDSLHTILRGTEADIQQYIVNFRDDFNKFAPEQIAFPRTISDVKKYHDATTIYSKGTPIHVRGALLYNHLLETHGLTTKYPLIRDGDKIKFMYLKTPNPIREDCIAFIDQLPSEFGLTEYVDYDTMFDKTFEDAVQNILDSLNWSTKPKATLEDFFA